ncbi:hypothetical protein PLICRDRAFT_57466 [Plicaturopsis crispa FD-325 SS-3]|uniref:MYND-type domain-containing protein n=1 Tax=Plicaturopsis crispa FD-325 SS-3 TaxID=944288 RepID=A0A0C9SL70_PLICR|nr:hypothetical protein PLICRDRAFT_57466 [Plicaturopsis crispa FD-325 SS-3]
MNTENSKFPHLHNPRDVCTYSGCNRVRNVDGKPLQLCNGCRMVRFCSREHLQAEWPQHKKMCKHTQKNREIYEAMVAQRGRGDKSLPPQIEGLPEPKARQYVLEDWAEAHRHSIAEALAHAIDLDDSFSMKRQHAVISLSYRPESEGNPSIAFTVTNVEIIDNTASEIVGAAAQFASFLPPFLLSVPVTSPNWFASIPCGYLVDNDIMWLAAVHLSKEDRPRVRPSDRPWFWSLQHFAQVGVVFRLQKDSQNWVPGLVDWNKHRDGWVWKEKTIGELELEGIHLARAGQQWFERFPGVVAPALALPQPRARRAR